MVSHFWGLESQLESHYEILTTRFREHVLEHFHEKTDRNREMPQTANMVGYIVAYSIRMVWKCFLCVQYVRQVIQTRLQQHFRAFSASQDLM